ncbi:hypothetical protein CYY_001369 [Polysphondylium violaceum]|uniref:Uncharacterized protein n=1 Tax=Polysphondylium violaceum TaxID=133409 RepID=A0A8J4PZX3_9MYCE|nr:hypothetical protein CYY_001369 [Polysphondylium violaceum]
MFSKQILYCLIIFLNVISLVNGKTFSEWITQGESLKYGWTSSAGSTIAGVVVGTPVFFIVKFFIEKLDERKRQENEIKKLESKINRKSMSMGTVDPPPSRRATISNGDTYGTTKMIKEVIEGKSFNIQTPGGTSIGGSPISTPQQSQGTPLDSSGVVKCSSFNSTSTPGNRDSTIITNMPQFNDRQSLNMSINSNGQHISTPPHSSFLIMKSSQGGAPLLIDHSDSINKLLTPPSPVLSTFGKSSMSSRINSDPSPILSPDFFTNLKRTLGDNKKSIVNQQVNGHPQIQKLDHIKSSSSLTYSDSNKDEQETISASEEEECAVSGADVNFLHQSSNNIPTNNRSRISMSQNLSLLTYLSSNTIPKDHWNCLVYRVLELCNSFWFSHKFDGNQSLTFVNQIELALSGFSDHEKMKKSLKSGNDEYYTSPVVEQVYQQLSILYQYISLKKVRVDKDIISIFGIFSIMLPSLFGSFSKWMDENTTKNNLQNLGYTRKNIIEFSSIPLSNSYRDKKVSHKFSIYFLIDYIRTLLYQNIENSNGITLYKIVDKYHGIADDIDKILYQSKDFKDDLLNNFSEKRDLRGSTTYSQNRINNNNGSNTSLISNTNSNPNSTIRNQILDLPFGGGGVSKPMFTVINNQNNSVVSEFEVLSLSDDGENNIEDFNNSPNNNLNNNNNNVSMSIINRFNQIDYHLKNNQNNKGKSISLAQQRSIISLCRKHLDTTLNIFTSSEKFNNKFKVECIPVIKLLQSTLENLEDNLETGISIELLPVGEFIEWVTSFSKISTTLNNLIIKNSSNISIIKEKENEQSNSPLNNSPKLTSSIKINNTNTNNNNNNNYKPSSSPMTKIRYKLSPFGSPVSTTTFLSTSNPGAAQSVPISSSSPQQSFYKLNERDLPSNHDRCLQIVQLSQESIMLAILSSFSLCHRELVSLKNNNINDGMPLTSDAQDDEIVNYFTDSVGVFYSSIRTNIFCTFMLLNPLYSLSTEFD